jgi:hypothetical protein
LIEVDLFMLQLQLFLICLKRPSHFLVSSNSSALQDGAHELPDPLPLWQGTAHFM